MPRLKAPRIQPHARSETAKILRRASDNARNKAKRERVPLSEDEVKQQIQLTEGEVAALNQIAAGRPMRNAGEVIRALKLKMEFSVKKPVQEVSSDQKMTIEVLTLGPEGQGSGRTTGPEDKPNPPYSPPSSAPPTPEVEHDE